MKRALSAVAWQGRAGAAMRLARGLLGSRQRSSSTASHVSRPGADRERGRQQDAAYQRGRAASALLAPAPAHVRSHTTSRVCLPPWPSRTVAFALLRHLGPVPSSIDQILAPACG